MGTFEIPAIGEAVTASDPKIKKAIEGLNTITGASNKIKGAGMENETIEAAQVKEGTLEGKQIKDGTIKNADLEGEIEGAKLKAATIADTKLESPNNSFYRSILLANGLLFGALGSGVYLLGSKEGASVAMQKSAVTSGSLTGTHFIVPAIFNFAKADFEVVGKTQKLRLRTQVAVNSVKPTIKFTFGLYPVTVSGAENVIIFTAGTVVTGSTLEFNEPAASTVTSKETSDFTIPSDGAYLLGVNLSAEMTSKSAVSCHGQLQTRSV